MKAITKLILFILMMCLVGCGTDKTDTLGNVEPNEQPSIGNEGSNSDISDMENTSINQDLAEKETIPVSTTAENISVAVVPMQSRIVATSENRIYFCNWEKEGEAAALYSMEIGQEALTEICVELPPNMRIYDMTTDKYNQFYLLLRTKTSESDVNSIIRKLDADGNFMEDIDITKALGDNVSLHYGFLITDAGDFYLKGVGVSVGISKDGKFLWKTMEMDDGISCYAGAVGKDGEIYIAYQKDEREYLGKINMEDGSILEVYELSKIESSNTVLAMKAGTDSDFLLYEDGGGVWAFDFDGTLENRIDISEGTLQINETIVFRTFLDDGRLLLVKNVSENGILKERIFQYIPAGK